MVTGFPAGRRLRTRAPRLVGWPVLVGGIVVVGVVSLFLGAAPVSPAALLKGDTEAWRLLLLSRVPRLVAVLLSGAGLAVSGLILQTLLQNRFASPSTVATADGARLGFLVAVLLFPAAPAAVRVAVAAAVAMAATAGFVAAVRRLRYRSVVIVPLVGLVLGNVLSAIAEALAFHFDMVQSVSSWLTGDFSMVVQGRYEMLYLGIPLMAVALRFARRITVAGFGGDTAHALGLDYTRVLSAAVLIVSGITALVVVVGGQLPFVGLVVPNLVALIAGDNLRVTLLPTALAGAFFVLIADVVGRVVIFPYEIPIGLTIGVIGSAAFLVTMSRRSTHVAGA